MIGEILEALIDGILANLPGPSFFERKSSKLTPLSRYLTGSISLVAGIAVSMLLSNYLGWFHSPKKSIWLFVLFMSGVVCIGIGIYWLALRIAELHEGGAGTQKLREPRRLSQTGEMVVFVTTGISFLLVSIGGVYLLRLSPGWLDIPSVNFSLLGISAGISIMMGALALVWIETRERTAGVRKSASLAKNGSRQRTAKR